jgi:hypothetical protein
MSNVGVVKTAEQAVARAHRNYGEPFQLLKYVPSATGGIYRQRRKQYQAPINLIGCVSREPSVEARTPIGEGSERTLHITVPVSFVEELFGEGVALSDMITTSDRAVVDNRVWRITQSHLTGRVGQKPLIYDLDLREIIGASEEPYHG